MLPTTETGLSVLQQVVLNLVDKATASRAIWQVVHGVRGRFRGNLLHSDSTFFEVEFIRSVVELLVLMEDSGRWLSPLLTLLQLLTTPVRGGGEEERRGGGEEGADGEEGVDGEEGRRGGEEIKY